MKTTMAAVNETTSARALNGLGPKITLKQADQPMEKQAAKVASKPARKSSGQGFNMRHYAFGAFSILCGLVLWQVLSMFSTPLFLPSPATTWNGALELWNDGTLTGAVLASGARILIGWTIGVVVGVPLGIFMGHYRIVRQFFEPYIEFFRFIPPIAFVTLAVIWMGPGEVSKISLIFYTTVFIVTLNTLAGALAVPELRLRAAAALGANKLTTLWTVVVPSAVPYMVTGARIAMGNSFLTIVSAEIVAAEQGLGALIWIARNYARTEWVFAGIIVLGLMGFVFDRILRLATQKLLKRYGVST
ncbi:ABC transporter permease [soil metagenome]